jgi:hypothetical protein
MKATERDGFGSRNGVELSEYIPQLESLLTSSFQSK